MKNTKTDFVVNLYLLNFIICWPCISVRFLLITNLKHFFNLFIYFTSLHVSSSKVLIIRRSNCINTTSGMVSLCKWLLGMSFSRELHFPPDQHTKQSLTQPNHTRWCINTIRSPDDKHCDARNMQRGEMNKYSYIKKCTKLVISQNYIYWIKMQVVQIVTNAC